MLARFVAFAAAAVALAPGAHAQVVRAGIIQTVVRGLVSPTGIALDSDGSLVIAETGGHRVRRLAPASGSLTLLAGTGAPGSAGDGNTAALAQLYAPWGVAVGRSREIYIADFGECDSRRRRTAFSPISYPNCRPSRRLRPNAGDGAPRWRHGVLRHRLPTCA